MHQAETSRRLYTTPHPLDCGIALHARMMDVCILAQRGEGLVPRPRHTAPETFLHAMAPSRQGMVVAVACLGTWDGLADLCADDGLPGVLGPALSMPAIHGGTANHATSAAHTSAAVRRGGRLPQTSGSPATRRATRAVLRRRRPLAHPRAARLAHGPHTPRPSPLPARGTPLASTATRAGGAERCADAAVHQSLAGDLARITSDDARRRAVARPIVTTATHHDATPRYRRHTVPGSGTMRSLVLL